MAGNSLVAERMRVIMPHTHNALTHLVMALAATANSLGKKTWFGRDKGVEAYETLLGKIRQTITAMTLDGFIQAKTPSPDVIDELMLNLQLFSQAYPNWQDAYTFASYFFLEERDNAIATIERLR